MSAAFDEIDHAVLLSKLEEQCGIKGTAHRVFRSHLSDRTQKGDYLCSVLTLTASEHGSPQGSVLGLVLFTMYSLSQ